MLFDMKKAKRKHVEHAVPIFLLVLADTGNLQKNANTRSKEEKKKTMKSMFIIPHK